MKTRAGFVSNSSSSSFVINKQHLTKFQIYALLNHSELGAAMDMPYADEWAWHVAEDADTITGDVSMDNFDMHEFMREVGIDPEKAEWSYS